MHIYADTGTYKVSLTVTNFKTGCSYTQVQDVVIAIEKADFTASNTAICTGSGVDFQTKNINAANISSYHWKFGDGAEAFDSSSINHIYNKAGR